MKNGKIILQLTVLQALLILVAACAGIFIPEFYKKESLNWRVQSLGQDIIDACLIVPVLIFFAMGVWKKRQFAASVWGGVNLYLVYTYAIYCFDIHFNNLFLVYCITLGLSVYSLVLFFYEQIKLPGINVPDRFFPVKLTAVYFIVISCLFYILWLGEIIPSVIQSESPAVLTETGLFTNPVHVIDLAIILPGIFLAGILLLKKKSLGYRMAPVLLTFVILIDITIGFLSVFMKKNGIESSSVLSIVMGVLAIFSLFLLRVFRINLRR
jgi:hypothetical protein